MSAAGIVLRYPVESLKALRKLDGCLRYFNHDRTRSNTRPRNQKLSTPAHSA